jgi:hypothetical protein
LVDRFTAFQKVDKTLNRHTRPAKARRTAHALRADPHCLIEPVLLVGGHNPKLSHIWGCVKASAAIGEKGMATVTGISAVVQGANGEGY